MSEKIINYYNNEYNEEQRLADGCDNRHIVEREVKKRILSNYLKSGMKIADIGAGTGIYSVYAAEIGCEVDACDIVPEHVEIIQKKALDKKLPIKARIANANELPYKDETYDVVLVAGPIYHTHGYEGKNKIIKEACRICKPGGNIIVDFLSMVHGFIQNILLDHKFLLDKDVWDMVSSDIRDPIFNYDNMHTMKMCFDDKLIDSLMFYGTDSITRFLKDDINNFTKEELNKWIEYIYVHSADTDIIGLSEHCIAVATKGPNHEDEK